MKTSCTRTPQQVFRIVLLTSLQLLANRNIAEGFSLERRQFISNAVAAVGAATLTQCVDVAHAACLPGDLSTDCIGVYKLPYTDSRESSWLNNKEELEMFAPDIRFVEADKMPATVEQAKEQLRVQRKAIKGIRDVVFEGNLREAGVLILKMIPKVTGAGIKIQQYVEKNEKKRTDLGSTSTFKEDKESEDTPLGKFNESFEDLIVQWNTIDISIGQALRGQRGVTAVAQIELLSDLKDVATAFDDFMRVVDLNTMK